jgi:uncharacterized iron-regulated protein
MHRFMRVAGALALAALLAACAGLPNLPALASKPDPEPLQPVTPNIEIPRGSFFTVNASGVNLLDDAAFGRMAGRMAYVLLGEGHSVACDHVIQARALLAMAGADHAPVVGLEMVSVDKESALEQFSRGQIPVDKLEKVVDWAAVWGFPFEGYRPVFETAKGLGLPVAALNLPRDVVRSLSSKGVYGLTPQEAAWMPYQLIPPPAAQLESLRQEFEMHQQFRKDDGKDTNSTQELDRFIAVQSAWDSKMAESAVEASNKYDKPVAVLAGGGHVEYGWGIASRLLGLDPGAPILLVMPWRDDGPVDPASADVFFYCPETHESRLGFTLEAQDKSALVVAVKPGSAAERAGFRAGDILTTAAGVPVEGLWSLHTAAAKAKTEGRPLVFGVERDGQHIELSLPVETGGPVPAKQEEPAAQDKKDK